MPSLETWLLFLPAALLLGLAPGPGVLYVLSRSLAQGGPAGLASAAGVLDPAPRPPRRASRRRIFLQGIFVEALNPKTALFFLALLPQFVDPGQGAVALQMLLLGAVVTLITLAVDLAVAFGSGGLAAFLLRRPPVQRLLAWLSGSILCALGLRVAFAPAR